MPLTNSLSRITKSLEDIHDILKYEQANFETKFAYYKKQIVYQDGNMQQQLTGRQFENFKEESDTEYESELDEVQEELDCTKQKLQEEERKNAELNQDVIDLKAMVDLYFREAQRREVLEEKWRETTTAKLTERVRSLKDELYGKIGEINNLENVATELRSALCRRDEEIFNKNLEIKCLQRKLESVHEGDLVKKCDEEE